MHLTTTVAIGTQAAGRPARRGRDAQRLDRACSNGEAPVAEPYVGHKRRPPARGDIDRVAVDLIRRRGREILAMARRYAYNLDDADDAHQRGLEILLTKAPTTREVDLVRWLKTVVLRTIRSLDPGEPASPSPPRRHGAPFGSGGHCTSRLPMPRPPRLGGRTPFERDARHRHRAVCRPPLVGCERHPDIHGSCFLRTNSRSPG
jgi:hypothetical protein